MSIRPEGGHDSANVRIEGLSVQTAQSKPGHARQVTINFCLVNGKQPITKPFLTSVWPEYQNPIPARRLAEHLGLSEIQVAASVEVDLRAFLSLLGFPIG
jgi:hypothetical protein